MDGEREWLEQMLSRCRGLLAVTTEPRLVALLQEMIRYMEERLAALGAPRKG